MTFEQLDFFIAAVKYDTFFEAAETLHTTQSTLSKQIMKLEKELNLKLLDRSHRSAVPTEAGRFFFEEALILSHQYHQTLHRMNEFQNSHTHTLSIGTLPILSQYGLRPLLKSFSEQNQDLHLELEEVEDHELMEGLDCAKYDLVIARKIMSNSNQHLFYPLVKDRLVVLLPQGHPLTRLSNLTLRDLISYNLILMQPHTSAYHICCQLFRSAGLSPRILRTARIESIIGAVSVNEGISLLPEGNLRLFQHEHLTAIPFESSDALYVGIIRKKTAKASSAVSRFLLYQKKERPFISSADRTPNLPGSLSTGTHQ